MKEREIFAAAMQIAAQEPRNAYLDQACGGDAELRRRIDELIIEQERLGSFLERPIAPRIEAMSETMALESVHERAGSQIGPYKLLQLLGEGGMGAVYLAEQGHPVRRRVALKIIKPGMDTRQVIARFEAERQALAMMDHPNIAKVLDAGTTPVGRPFFVMELVKGLPITQYCDQQHLPPRQRLELFIPVCQAVQHAHQKGIIHRDLKPSNVLIALYDGRPVAKVIDFGVAKATNQRLTEKTMFTEVGSIVGTLEYMAPEQAELNNLDIDTRADIYSLGVLLYELLTGSPPFSGRQLRSKAFDEMLRVIREEEPPRPSTKVSSSSELPTIAANRQLDPRRLEKLIRGELDWIVMKCLEKQRQRRYETANDVALDLGRYLQEEPVVAGPPSALYRLRKFWRRNRAGVIGATAMLLLLMAGVAVSTWQAIRATRAEAQSRQNENRAIREAQAKEQARQAAVASESRARAAAEAERDAKQQALTAAEAERKAKQEAMAAAAAERSAKQQALDAAAAERKAKEAEATQRKQAEAVASLLESIFSTASPSQNQNFKSFLVQRLDAIARSLDQDYSGEPLTRARLRFSLGAVYRALGDDARSLEQFEKAWQEQKTAAGADHPAALATLASLIHACSLQRQHTKAIALSQENCDVLQKKLGPDDAKTILARSGLGWCYFYGGRFQDAVAIHREVLAATEAQVGADTIQTIQALHSLGVALLSAGNPAEAEQQFEQALARARKLFGDSDRTISSRKNWLGYAYYYNGKRDEAIALWTEIGDADAWERIATVYLAEERFDLAMDAMEKCVAVWAKSGRPNDQYSWRYKQSLATAYQRGGQLAKAETALESIINEFTRQYGERNQLVLKTQAELAGVYQTRGKTTETLKIRQQVANSYKARGDVNDPDAINAFQALAKAYNAAGQTADAAKFLQEAVKHFESLGVPFGQSAMRARDSLAETYLLSGNIDEAEKIWNAMLLTAKDGLPSTALTRRSIARRLLAALEQVRAPERADKVVDLYLTLAREELAAEPQKLADALTQCGWEIVLHKLSATYGERLERAALQLWNSAFPEDGRKFFAEATLGICLARQNKDAEAEPLLLSGYAGMARHIPPGWAAIASPRLAAWELSQMYSRQNKEHESTHWLEKYNSLKAPKKPAVLPQPESTDPPNP